MPLQRHNLLTKRELLLRLEKATAERTVTLTGQQTRALERFSPEFRERHIEAPHTGALVAAYTVFVSTLKGVGKLYLQTAIDCHSRHACARHSPLRRFTRSPLIGLTPSKLPVTAVHLMNGDVISTFEAHEAKIATVQSKNGRVRHRPRTDGGRASLCGRPDQHPHELFFQREDIAHRTTRVKRPQSNRNIKRLERTLHDEHFRVEGRRTCFETIEEMKVVLDDYLVRYNTRRPH